MKTTNKLAKRLALLTVLVLGSSVWVSAQPNPEQIGQPEGGLGRRQGSITTDGSTNRQSLQAMKINKGSSLIGAMVKNPQGEKLGKIHDLVIDFNSDRVAYVVLASEVGLLSAGKLHAVPLRAFQPDAEGKALILNADKAKLDRSDGFAKDNWPAVTTATWGAEPFWQDAQGDSNSQEGRDLEQLKLKELDDAGNKSPAIEPNVEPQSQP